MKKKKIPWDEFVSSLRERIARESPSKVHIPDRKETLSWNEFVERIRYRIEHDDKELLGCIEKQNQLIESLKNIIEQKDTEIERLKNNTINEKQYEKIADGYTRRVISMTQKYINKNKSGAHLPLIRDLYNYIFNEKYKSLINSLTVDTNSIININNIHDNNTVNLK